jgi:hypothetical protein
VPPLAVESSLPPLSVMRVRSEGGVVSVRVRCGWPDGETCPGQIVLRSHLRVGAGPGQPESTRVVRLAVARRTFRLAGGRIHTFKVVLDEARRPLLQRRGGLRVELLVAIPGSRKLRRLRLG